MQRLEVSCAVQRIYTSLGAKGLISRIGVLPSVGTVLHLYSMLYCFSTWAFFHNQCRQNGNLGVTDSFTLTHEIIAFN